MCARQQAHEGDHDRLLERAEALLRRRAVERIVRRDRLDARLLLRAKEARWAAQLHAPPAWQMNA